MMPAMSPGRANLNGYEGTQSLEESSREAARVAWLGPDGATGTFTMIEANAFSTYALVAEGRWSILVVPDDAVSDLMK